MAKLHNIVALSLTAVQPLLAQEYTHARPAAVGAATSAQPPPDHCFELLGYDFMLDSAGTPWLLEVNHSPSFATDAPLDAAVKGAVLADTLRLVRPDAAAARRGAAVRAPRQLLQ